MRGGRLFVALVASVLLVVALAWFAATRRADPAADSAAFVPPSREAGAGHAQLESAAAASGAGAAGDERRVPRGTELGRIAGHVRRVDRTPVAGVRLTVVDVRRLGLPIEEWLEPRLNEELRAGRIPGARVASSGADGAFEFAALPVGEYELVMEHSLGRDEELRCSAGRHATGEEALELLADDYQLELELVGAAGDGPAGSLGLRPLDVAESHWTRASEVRRWAGRSASFPVEPGRGYRASWVSVNGLASTREVRIDPEQRVTRVALVAPAAVEPGRVALVLRGERAPRWSELALRVEDASGELVRTEQGSDPGTLSLAPGSYTLELAPRGARRGALARLRRSFRVFGGETSELECELPEAGSLVLELAPALAAPGYEIVDAPANLPDAAGSADERPQEPEEPALSLERRLGLVACVLVADDGRAERLHFAFEARQGEREQAAPVLAGIPPGERMRAVEPLAPGRYRLEARCAGRVRELGELAVGAGRVTRARFALP